MITKNKLLICLIVTVIIYGCSKESMVWELGPKYENLSSCSWNNDVTFVDSRDGRLYRQTQIGTQCWMAQNLNYGNFIRSGNGGLGGSLQADNDTTEKYCYMENEPFCDLFGGAYEWDEMMNYSPQDSAQTGTTRGICPEGWHIPTLAEWKILAVYLGGNEMAGKKMKETSDLHWRTPNSEATNEVGFTAIPAPYREYSNGSFGEKDYWSVFWTATSFDTVFANMVHITIEDNALSEDSYVRESGYFVRCVKDVE